MGRQEKIAKLEALLTRVQARAQEPRHLRLVAVAPAQVAAAAPVATAAAAPVQARISPVPTAAVSGRASPVPASTKLASERPTPLATPAPALVLTPDVIRPEFTLSPVARFASELTGQTLAEILHESLTTT